jgi:hypothetical protein
VRAIACGWLPCVSDFVQVAKTVTRGFGRAAIAIYAGRLRGVG